MPSGRSSDKPHVQFGPEAKNTMMMPGEAKQQVSAYRQHSASCVNNKSKGYTHYNHNQPGQSSKNQVEYRKGNMDSNRFNDKTSGNLSGQNSAKLSMSRNDQRMRTNITSASKGQKSSKISGSGKYGPNMELEQLRQAWLRNVNSQSQSQPNLSQVNNAIQQLVPYGSSRSTQNTSFNQTAANLSFDVNRRIFAPYLTQVASLNNPNTPVSVSGGAPYMYPSGGSYRSSMALPSNKSHPYNMWSNYPSSVTATGANLASGINWTGSKYGGTPAPPPPSTESGAAQILVGPVSFPSFEAMTGDTSMANSRGSSSRPPLPIANTIFIPTKPSMEMVAGGDSNLSPMERIVPEDNTLKSAGTSPLLFANWLHNQQTNSALYQEWASLQQKEIKRILKGEIEQIKEMIENFGERLDSIQLSIKKSVEVSKSQETETSTTSSSMTVTKKLGRTGSRKKHHPVEPKNQGQLISRELIKTLTGYDSNNDQHATFAVPKQMPQGSSRSTKSGPCPKHSTFSARRANRSNDGDVSVEIVRENESKIKPNKNQRTNSKDLTRYATDAGINRKSGPSHSYDFIRKYQNYQPYLDNNDSQITFDDEPVSTATSNKNYTSQYRASSYQPENKISSNAEKLAKQFTRPIQSVDATRSERHDSLDSQTAPFQFQYPLAVNATKVVVNPVVKVDRKMNYISPIASRPVSTESKLPLIPETDEMSIHCLSSRESDMNNNEQQQQQQQQQHPRRKESVEHERNAETDESTVTTNNDDHPDLVNVPAAAVGGRENGKTQPGKRDLCSALTGEVMAQGDKLDERISSMRSEISELKQWIMMLQNSGGDLNPEQGDVVRPAPSPPRPDQSRFQPPAAESYQKIDLECFKDGQ